jgi:tRNA/tmRNA/rRNA uracil-C5-methylase (TrmA/RlmC/RlmD family)
MQTDIRIERFADQGRCVGHIDGRVVFVRFALPGELVTIELDEPHERKDRFWTGEVVKVLEPSEYRIEPAWSLAGPLAWGGGVGGADLIHVSLEGQEIWKASTIREQMKRLGHVDCGDFAIERMPGDIDEHGLHWRTRIEMIADDDGKPSMRRRGTHTRIPIDTMPLASKAALAIAQAHHIWDGGFDPGSRIRVAVPEPRSVDTQATHNMNTDVTRDGETRNKNASCKKVSNGEISNRNKSIGAANSNEAAILNAIGDNYAILVNGVLVAGSQHLHEQTTVDGTRFDYMVDANGFWQMHRHAPLALPAYVIDQVQMALANRDHALIWDLYSGSGLFTLSLATLAAKNTEVLSVEGAQMAVRNARENLQMMHADSVEARIGDVAKTLETLPSDKAHPDVIVLDPPRAGAKARVCRQMAQSGAGTIIYIACDPTSLARDTAILTNCGYTLSSIRAFDIYPMTHHVETVAVFTMRRESD